MLRWSVPLALAVLLAAPARAAEPSAPHIYAGALGGWTRSTGPTREIAGDGWNAILVLAQFVDAGRRFAVGTELGHYDLGQNGDAKVRMHPVEIVFQGHLRGSTARLRPFVQGGFGLQYVRAETPTVNRYDYDFGTSLGAGAAYLTRGTLDLQLDAGYHWVFAEGSPLDRQLGFVTVRLGVTVPLAR